MKADQLPRSENGKEFTSYASLLSEAHQDGLARVRTALIQIPTADNGRLAIVKAEVETSKGLFEALGDASPESVDNFLAPHLIRVAETRAKARALRDAVNVGITSFEELDGVSLRSEPKVPESGAAERAVPTSRPTRALRSVPTPRSPRAAGNGSETMTEAQRRYLFRILAGQGYQREAAEERLKDLFDVSSLSQIGKAAATRMIDELLQTTSPQSGGGGNGAGTHPQR